MRSTLLVLAFCFFHGAQATSFSNEQVITSSADGAWSVYAADMNGDSFVDILVASYSDAKVRLFINDGDANSPSFTEQVITSSATSAISVYAADVNGDLSVDILVASLGDDKVRLFINDGNISPSFTEQLITSSADGVYSVYATDVNGDLSVDILVASRDDDKVRLFINDGNVNPSFAEQLITSSATSARSVYATDVNGDLSVDILVASHGDDKVRLFINDGNVSPSFTEQVITSSADGARSVFAVDVNGDSFVDILVASLGDDKVRLFINDGSVNPSFTEQLITSSADYAHSVRAMDMNGDSFADILVASIADDKVRLFINDGNVSPSFTEQVITSSADGARSVFAVDVNGDSFVDILVASFSDDKVRLFMSDSTPKPTMQPTPKQLTQNNGACFHGNGTVLLQSGSSKYLSELNIGEFVKAYDAEGKFLFSSIAKLPHAHNDEPAAFLTLKTETGKEVDMTSDHYIPKCDLKVVTAGELVVGDCLLTADGKETLIAIFWTEKYGVYTAVTDDKFIEVNGIVASPFSKDLHPEEPELDYEKYRTELERMRQGKLAYMARKSTELKEKRATDVSVTGLR